VSAVLEQINKIEIASADALKRLREEREVLEGRIKAMDDMKGDVQEAVYLRVRSDYSQRVHQLHDQARPLLEEARKQYAELRVILDKLQGDIDAVNLDRQELELRHKLGEFDAKEFQQQLKAIESSVSEKQQWHEQARQLKERFLVGVTSENELVALPSKPANQVMDITNEIQQPAAAKVTPQAQVTPQPPPGAVNQTMVMPAIRPGAPPPAAAPPAAPAGSEATAIFRPARLVPQNPEAGKTTHALALKPVVIGADPGADIRIGGPGVESKHAQIVPTANGYLLTDFDTKHGTRVNAIRVREQQLGNEDVIQIGAARFVFRQ
jgi:hypothetical protein